jgi:hypothetical protein
MTNLHTAPSHFVGHVGHGEGETDYKRPNTRQVKPTDRHSNTQAINMSILATLVLALAGSAYAAPAVSTRATVDGQSNFDSVVEVTVTNRVSQTLPFSSTL